MDIRKSAPIILLVTVILAAIAVFLAQRLIFTPQVTTPDASSSGLSVSSSKHFFDYLGKPLYMVGESGTQVVPMNGGLNYQSWLDYLSGLGMKSVLIWGWIAPDPNDSRLGNYKGKSALLPWPVSNNRYNLQSWNESYWNRLNSIVSYAKGKGMTVVITVFFGWAKDGSGTVNWPWHPFHSNNGGYTTNSCDVANIASSTELNTQAFNSSWSARQKIQWHWEEYALRLINIANTHKNVAFDYRDEWSYCNTEAGNSESFWRNFFMSRGQIYSDRTSSASFRVTNGSGNPSWGSTPAMKVEDPALGWDGYRREAWNRTIAGSHYFMHNDLPDQRPNIGSWDPVVGGDPRGNLGVKYVAYASNFWNSKVKNLDSLSPVSGANPPTMASAGNEYVVWKQGGGSFSVNLPTGNYDTFWFDPINGTYTSAGTVSGGSRSFNRANDSVLHIVKTGTQPSNPPTNPPTAPPTAPPTNPPGTTPGDADNDGDVDGVDYTKWLNNYNQTNSLPSNQRHTVGDFNRNGTTDGVDYTVWLNNYGSSSSGGNQSNPPSQTPPPGGGGSPSTHVINVDSHTGDEETTEPRTDANNGQAGDNPQFQRNNVTKAHNDYWYTSQYSDGGHPDPGVAQWIDYRPNITGRYRLTTYYRFTGSRASYPAKYIINHAGGTTTKDVQQNQGTEGTYYTIQLGDFDLNSNSYIRVQDTGTQSITFHKMEFTKI